MDLIHLTLVQVEPLKAYSAKPASFIDEEADTQRRGLFFQQIPLHAKHSAGPLVRDKYTAQCSCPQGAFLMIREMKRVCISNCNT